tara:strand:+ start:105 stop:458 length:354 start_codon:yes stop_codon:yes gene_type:complete
MNPHKISFVNAVTLISFGLWGYFDGDVEKNITALIPVFFGVIILVLFPGLKNKNKIVSHIVVLLTFFILVALIVKPLVSQIESGDQLGITRVSLMILSCLMALVVFINNFIKNRSKK